MENLDLFNGINATSIALLTFAVIGMVRIYTAIINQDYETAGTIVVAGAAGALFAPFVTEVTWFMGMLIGFSASGVITTASYFGSCSAVQVDKANVINTETLTGTNSKKKNA
jgi:hypothetical protein